jgi:hypothetical protein
VENPLRSEDAAFRLLLWVVLLVAVILGILFVVRALT